MSCGVGCGCSSDPKLLCLWCRLAAVAPVRPLSGDLPYAAVVVLKSKPARGGGGGGESFFLNFPFVGGGFGGGAKKNKQKRGGGKGVCGGRLI